MKTNRDGEDLVVLAVQSGVLSVDEHGRIWRHKRRGWDNGLKEAVDRPCDPVRAERDPKTGYLQVQVKKNKITAQASASRVVYRVRVGDIPSGLTINHKNGVKTDNRPENLELATYTEQTRHSMEVLKNHSCLKMKGENNHMAKLTEASVMEIRHRLSSGELMQSIAIAFGVSRDAIRKIATRGNWAWLT